MYYYIFEPPKSSQERSYYEKLQLYAREFGIYGEIVSSSPARSAEELVQIGLSKNYTTIVAIGHDTHINKVVSQVLNLTPSAPVVCGIIATDPESMLYERWGFKRPEEAMEAIKFRRLNRFDVGLIEPNHFFISSARIECKKPTRVTLEVDHWQAEAIIDRVEISGNLYILLERYFKEDSIGRSLVNWLAGKTNFNIDQSIFKGKVVRITSSNSLPIYVGNSVVARTPITIYRKPNALNIITRRDKIVAVS